MRESEIRASISCNLDVDILAASLPLFEKGSVEGVEWSFDALFNYQEMPSWFYELLREYSNQKRLVGHGIYFSLFSGGWSMDQLNWLLELEKLCSDFQFDHITEHFGFMSGKDFHSGAPLPVPFTKEVLMLGQDRLKRIYEACKCPVGLENLALAFSKEDIERHGSFLNELVHPINGFIILDLHNLYCQIKNFNADFQELIKLYPLDKVREIHISGGSWEPSSLTANLQIRRDTHDDRVPNEVFELLEEAIDLCPNLKYVVLEQMGRGLTSKESKAGFQNDFLRMSEIIDRKECVKNVSHKLKEINTFLPQENVMLDIPFENGLLREQQKILSEILENCMNYQDARVRLLNSPLAGSDWNIEQWEPSMLETAISIAQKWKRGFVKTA